MAKPTRASVLAFGLPPPAAASPPLLVEQVDTATGLLFYRAHGLSADDPISLRLVRDTTLGAPTPALPTGLAEGVTYYAQPSTSDAFRLATSSGGSPISGYAAEGTRFSWLFDPFAALDAAIDKAWTAVLADCTAHGGEVEADIITDAAGALAVRFYVAHMAAGDPETAQSYDGIAQLYTEVYQPKLDAYFKGVPVRGATDATPSIGEAAPRFRKLGASAPTNWGTCRPELV